MIKIQPKHLGRLNIAAGVAYVAGGGLAGVAGFLAATWPGHSGGILAASAGLISVAGFIGRLIYPTTPPAPTDPVSPPAS